MKGVIFDLDGVILDSMAMWAEIAPNYLRSRNIEPEPSLRETVFSMTMLQGAEYIKDHYHLQEATEEIIQAVSKIMIEFYHNEVTLKEGAMDLLNALKERKIPITVATSSPRILVEKALIRNGVIPYVSKLFIADEIGVDKHTPEIYQKAAEFMGIKPEETYVFEDSLYALHTASKAGFQTVGVFDADGERNQEGLKKEADFYIRSLKEAIILLETIG